LAIDISKMSHRLIGSTREAVVTDFVNPHNNGRLIVTTEAGTRTERRGHRSSYTYQFEPSRGPDDAPDRRVVPGNRPSPRKN